MPAAARMLDSNKKDSYIYIKMYSNNTVFHVVDDLQMNDKNSNNISIMLLYARFTLVTRP